MNTNQYFQESESMSLEDAEALNTIYNNTKFKSITIIEKETDIAIVDYLLVGSTIVFGVLTLICLVKIFTI